jgi:aspartyl-tRNA(Asn)/glutamyl-tRNA(Gln) amidotransferase subunit B
MIHELLGQLAARKDTFSDNPVSVEQMGELVDMVQCGQMTGVYGVVCCDRCSCDL